MARARKQARQRRRAKSLLGSMRKFLTPEVFKQVRNAANRRKSPRWDLHPLLYILLLTTYCCGDSLPEKFEAARVFYVASCPKRKRPGKHFSSFEKAGAKLPMPILRALATAIRGPRRPGLEHRSVDRRRTVPSLRRTAAVSNGRSGWNVRRTATPVRLSCDLPPPPPMLPSPPPQSVAVSLPCYPPKSGPILHNFQPINVQESNATAV